MNDEPEILEANPEIESEAPAATDEASEPEASGNPTLVLRRQGADTDHAFEVFDGAVIGRFDPSSGPVDVDLSALGQESSTVSRKHAKIGRQDEGWTIRDLGSMNGLWVLREDPEQGGDFERVESAELTDGTEFALGNARFVFRLG